MKCPLSGKPCLMPKEVFITEVKEDGVQRLFLCRKCGDQYIENNLKDADVVTKAMEVMSTNGVDVSHTEYIEEEGSDGYDEMERLLSEPIPLPTPKPIEEVALMPQIKAVEARLQEAVEKEEFEIAANLRDILQELRDKLDDTEESV